MDGAPFLRPQLEAGGEKEEIFGTVDPGLRSRPRWKTEQ
jgi:hypothetical protein